MYYRRKILLALIEAFGGHLQRTDCLKLIFLYCRQSGSRPYDFFPHKYGGFSYVVYQDKQRLEALGFLSKQHGFKFSTEKSFLDQLKGKDKELIKSLVFRWKGNLGKPLLREVYLKYPYFAIRSEITEELLESDDFEKIKNSKPSVESQYLFTIGYEGKSIDAFVNQLIDVRKNPRSMKIGFSKTKLKQYLNNTGIGYHHISDLGIPSVLRQQLTTDADYQTLFDLYDEQILPNQKQALDSILNLMNKHNRIALMCFEAESRHCHRHRIVEYLYKNKLLTSETRHL